MKFINEKQLRFHHCDPAGIVFYPQFSYLLHEVQEHFLAHIGFPEHLLVQSGAGIPIVDLKTVFLGMCRHGDQLTLSLELTRIGNTSIGMQYEIHACADGVAKRQAIKLRARGVVVYSEVPNGKALVIPDDLRSALLPFLEAVKPMMQKIQPPDWAEPKGYANGVLTKGTLLFVGGQIGWNANQMFESDDFVAQARQALLNVAAVLKAGGAQPAHMARMIWYVVDRAEYLASLKALGCVYRDVMGRNFPAMTCVEVNGLMEARARVEIEVTAVLPD